MRLICLLALTSFSLATPLPFAVAKAAEGYTLLSGRTLIQTLRGKQLEYEAGDDKGHVLISLNGPELFGRNGFYLIQKHRGRKVGTYSVKGSSFCVKVQQEPPFCRQLLRARTGRYIVRGAEGDWPVSLSLESIARGLR